MNQDNTVARFSVGYHRCLDPQGVESGDSPALAGDREALVALYHLMVRTRAFDTKAIALQRTGQLGTFASSLGQEAIGSALGYAMADDDVLFPAYREYACQFHRGVRMRDILLYWGGDEEGMNFQGNARQDFPISVPIATHAPHAAGAAYAMKLRGEPRVAVCVLGDGATSKGDFYEAVNLAGAWKLPVVFVVCNNQWAISVPRSAQSGAETLAQKAIAGGIHGEQVDGNDLLALSDRFGKAMERARRGEGASLVEALTYRLSDHTTADDASRYRDPEEVKAQWENCPIKRIRQFLETRHGWSAAEESTLQADCAALVEAEVRAYLDTPVRAPASMFDHLYAELPESFVPQRDELNPGGDDNA
jgi:pyruvate dehydrogenase E1 component alpha subunit